MSEREISRRTFLKGIAAATAGGVLLGTEGCGKQKKSELPELQEAQKFVKENAVKAIEGTRCIDERYLHNQSVGKLARAGADLGYPLTLLAVNNEKGLGYEPIEIFNSYRDFVTQKKNRPVEIHSDEHIMRDSLPLSRIGCGHLSAASDEKTASAYGVTASQTREIIREARRLERETDLVTMEIVHGEHHAKGLLEVKSDNNTVSSSNSTRDQMYFIYDVKRDEAALEEIAEEVKLRGIIYQDLLKASKKQLDASLRKLASGEEIYAVEFKIKVPEVAFEAKIP